MSAADPPTAVISAFYTWDAIKYICTHEAEWNPFQTHYFSENLMALRIEPGPPDL
jgi:hypothetical protein